MVEIEPVRNGRAREFRAVVGEYRSQPRPSVAQAKAALLEELAQVLQGSYEPRLFVFGALVGLVYRTPRGWWYRLSRLPGAVAEGLIVPIHSGVFESAEEAERRLRYDVADRLGLLEIAHPEDRPLLAWVWQRRSQEAAREPVR